MIESPNHHALQDGNLASRRLGFGLARVLAERLSVVNETLFALYQQEKDAAAVRQLLLRSALLSCAASAL